MRHVFRMGMVLALLLASCIPFEAQSAEPLLIAVASDDGNATSIVGAHAAFSRYYVLFSGVTMVGVQGNPFLDKGVGAGPAIVDYLAQKGVAVIIAGWFGPPMIEAMKEKGMKYFVYSGVAQEAVERVVNYPKPAEKDSQR